MLMLYNSESFAVVEIEVAAPISQAAAGQAAVDARAGTTASAADVATDRDRQLPLTAGGYEIVDKFLRKEIFLQGALAQSFREGVEALIETRPSEEEMDDYIERFAWLMQQPVVLH